METIADIMKMDRERQSRPINTAEVFVEWSLSMHVSFGTVMLFSLACTQLVPLKKLGRVNRLMSLGVRVTMSW